jgi:hypothetical protein
MKKTLILTLLFLSALAFSDKSFAQETSSSKAKCETELRMLKKACDKIDPNSALEIEFLNTVDALIRGNIVYDKTNKAAQYIHDIYVVAKVVASGKCSSKHCKDAKEAVKRLERE